MKILFCIDSLEKGGAERVISNLANDYVKENEVVLVKIKDKVKYKIDKDIKQYVLKNKENTKILYQLKIFNDIIKDEQPDVVICFLTGSIFRALILRKYINAPIIISVRNDPKEEYRKLKNKIFMKLLYPKADGFVFQTKQAKEYFNKSIQNKSEIIPNPIKKEFITREQYVGKKENTIVSVGRLEKQKNHNLLIDAFYDISKKFPDYKLIIYGEGSQRINLEKKIQDLNMQDRIFLVGLVDDIQEKIEKAKLFVMSSDYEGMPNALMEAMALGLVVISTDCPCGGPRFLVENNKNGFLVETKNKMELTKALKKVLQLTDNEIENISTNAKKTASNLSEEKINKKWFTYIERVIHSYKEK